MENVRHCKVAVKNIQALYDWCDNATYQDARDVGKHVDDVLRAYHDREQENAISRAWARILKAYGFWDGDERKEREWKESRAERAAVYRQFFEYAQTFGQEIRGFVWNDFAFLYLGNQNEGVVVPHPDRYFECTDEKTSDDYLDTSPAELKLRLGAGDDKMPGLLRTNDAMAKTPRQAQNELERNEADIKTVKGEIEQVKKAQTGELAAMQAKIEAMQAELQKKKEAMLAELNAKMQAMEQQKERLEDQIYLLDSQIFAIRCYMGETVRFVQIRSGVPAPKTEPVVVHQKLRYLDEELGKLASLYEIQWSEMSLFEEFLKHSPLALDTFAPNTKCVVLVRLSRTGTTLGRDQQYSNILDRYRYFHGKTVGIIIRNGGNLYLGWTDENYVKIDDDLVGNVVDMTPEEEPDTPFESDKQNFKKRMREKKRKAMSDILSRMFVSNILQGIVDHSDLIPLPEGARFDQDNPYIKYAIADAWLEDNRFGSFDKLIERCNQKVTAGDMILTVQHLVPEHDRSWGSNSWASANRPWENSRGRGEANRTHDCSVSDCTLYPVNLVEYDEPVKMVRYRFRMPTLTGEPDEERWQYGETPERFWKEPEENEGKEFVLSYEKRERHVFVSIEKEENWRRRGMQYEREPRANFELYPDEYINLAYMNSVWLNWAITQRKLGDWKIGGQSVDYAYGIRYLKAAMDYIRKREEEEKALLDAVDASVCQNPDWPLQLSEWKMSRNVRAITPCQAKRFVKACRNNAAE